MENGIRLQLLAEIDEIMEQFKDSFEDASIKDNFGKISTKLNELGFDVLINNKQKAEFVPSSRLGEVVGQRDQFKTQVTELNKQLQTMKDAAKGNEELQAQLQELMDKNQGLLSEVETTKINTEIMLTASDAVNPKDVLVFVNRNNIKLSAKGEVLGVEAEVARIKAEKPYLFKSEQLGKKGGSDNSGAHGKPDKFTMNSLIRGAAGMNK